jgi:hypothetical protein
MAQAGGATLDQLGVPQELRDRAKIMWILTIFLGIGAWIVCAFIWKVEGQEGNPWFQNQLKQNMWAGIFAIIAWIFTLGGIVQLIYGVLGFLAIGKGQDFQGPVIAGLANK